MESDLPFLPESIKINKCNKLVCTLCDKNKYVLHLWILKRTLNHGLILRKLRRVIQFDKKVCLKEYINMNTELSKQAKNDFKKMNNTVFGKTMRM